MKNKHCFKTFIGLLFLGTSLFAQEDWPCNETLHGVRNVHMDCTEDILITSFSEDGANGSEIGGTITTSKRIIIRPGNTRVRIVPYANHHHKTGEKLTHTTKVGGGNTDNGQKIALKSNRNLEQHLTVHPNPIVHTVHIEATDPIKRYELTDVYGNILKTKRTTPTKRLSFSVQELAKGMYLLKIQLSSGKQHIKTIIKN